MKGALNGIRILDASRDTGRIVEFIHNEQRLKNNDKLVAICEELL